MCGLFVSEISLPHLHGESKTAHVGAVSRVPAADLEETVLKALDEYLVAQKEKRVFGIAQVKDRKAMAEHVARSSTTLCVINATPLYAFAPLTDEDRRSDGGEIADIDKLFVTIRCVRGLPQGSQNIGEYAMLKVIVAAAALMAVCAPSASRAVEFGVGPGGFTLVRVIAITIGTTATMAPTTDMVIVASWSGTGSIALESA